MRLLLDTHAFIWWIHDHPALSEPARQAIGAAGAAVTVSAASLWEAGIKWAAGRLELSAVDLLSEMVTNHFEELPVTGPHAIAAAALPRHHGDPFDRMLIAQAQLEGCRLVTRDRRISAYDVPLLW